MSSKARLTLLGLAAVLAAAAPATAQAASAYWYDSGVKVGGALGVEGASTWVMKGSLGGSPTSVYCNTSHAGSVSNAPTAGAGAFSAVGFGEACAVEMQGEEFQNCMVVLEAKSLPWPLQASYDEGEERFTVALSGIEVELRFFSLIALPICPLNGAKFIAKGSLTGDWENGAPSVLRFEEASGIAIYTGETQVGTAKVSDSLAFEDEEGGFVTLASE